MQFTKKNVTFLSPNKKVTKEIGLRGGMNASPMSASFDSFLAETRKEWV